MNITNVLHRSRTGGVDVALDTRPPAVPSNVYSLERGPDGGARWPRGGVVLVALLAIAAVLGAIGTAAGFASGDDGATERELRGQVATLTTQRAEALEDIVTLDGELASLRQQLIDAQDGADALAGQVGALEARIASLSEQRDVAQSSADALDAELTLAQQELAATQQELAATQQELAATQQELAATQQRLTDVTADRDALARRFPMEFAPSLDALDTVGTYDVTAKRIYCVGLTTCGSTPSVSDLTIRMTPEGYLRANVPGLVEGGLFRADGAFHLVADSRFAVPACAGVARTAGVTMTIFPGGHEIARDGTRTITGLDAVITVEAPAVGSCPAVLAFSSAELTAQA